MHDSNWGERESGWVSLRVRVSMRVCVCVCVWEREREREREEIKMSQMKGVRKSLMNPGEQVESSAWNYLNVRKKILISSFFTAVVFDGIPGVSFRQL